MTNVAGSLVIAPSRSDPAHFARALIEPTARAVRARARLATRAWPDAGVAVDAILLDSPARVTSATIDHAFNRDGSIWGAAGAELARASDPADFIFGPIGRGPRPIARLAAAHRGGSDTIDMIFSG